MVPDSLDFPYSIAPLVFPNFYLLSMAYFNRVCPHLFFYIYIYGFIRFLTVYLRNKYQRRWICDHALIY
jgi:hypothetical protein